MIPPQVQDEAATHALSVVEFGAKFAIAFAAIWGFVEKVAKPFLEWRRKRLTGVVREILKPEIERLDAIAKADSECVDRMDIILKRQTAIFSDVDSFIMIATDNRERHDETTELLNQVFGLDRRVDHAKRQEIDTMLIGLRARQKDRRRDGPEEPPTT